MATWSELNDIQKCDVVQEALKHHVSIPAIAIKYALNPESLSRKLRLLKQTGEADRYLNPQSDLSGELLRPSFTDGTVVINKIDSDNPDDRTAIIRPQQDIWRILLYGDTHFPYQDQAACDAFIRCAAAIEHDFVICAGDNCDLYGLSAYGKDPEMLFKNNLQREVAAQEEFFISLASVSSARKISLWGNHMQRYLRWLDAVPYVGSVEAYKPEHLFKLKDYGWYDFVGTIMFNADDDPYYPNPDLIIHHGTTARKNAGVTVQEQSKAWGFTSTIMGHVHRLSVAYKRTLRGQIVVAECGTLRDLRPEYVSYPDWTNGCLYITVQEHVVNIQPVLIFNGIAYFGAEQI